MTLEDELKVGQHHRLLLLDRERLEVEGVRSVISFDANRILVETIQGTLKLTGEELHIKHLDLEAQKLHVEGLVTALEYTEDRGMRGKGFLGRLFR